MRVRPISPPRRILVVKLASLGDVLTATPALRALRASFPAAHIAALLTPATAPALQGLDSLNEVIPFDKFLFDRPADALRGCPGALRLARALRAGQWDTLVLLHHLTTAFGVAKYAALALASGAAVRAGLENGRGRSFLTHGAPDRGFGWRHEADYSLSVVEQLGARHPGTPRLELAILPEDERWAAACWRDLGAGGDDVALLVPGSGAFSVARRWAPERFVAVGRSLRGEMGLAPLVLGGLAADERQLAQDVARGIGSDARVVPPAPNPRALGAMLRRCRLVVANDSGPVHVASAVGRPVVSIFGPSNHRAWGPYPPGASRNQIARDTVVCSPCIHRGHSFGTPAGCPARTCLAILEPATVMHAAHLALAGMGTPA